MNRNRTLGLVVIILVCVSVSVMSYPTIDTAMNRIGIMFGYDTASSTYRPIQVDQSGLIQTVANVSISTITAELAPGDSIIGAVEEAVATWTQSIKSVVSTYATLSAITDQRAIQFYIHNVENATWPIWISKTLGDPKENGIPIYSNARIIYGGAIYYAASDVATMTVVQEAGQ